MLGNIEITVLRFATTCRDSDRRWLLTTGVTVHTCRLNSLIVRNKVALHHRMSTLRTFSTKKEAYTESCKGRGQTEQISKETVIDLALTVRLLQPSMCPARKAITVLTD